jgi:Glycosyl hydrolase family 9
MAVKQLHYFAGDNDRGSYIAGFGDNPPKRNHHRNSACTPWEQLEDPKRHCEK